MMVQSTDCFPGDAASELLLARGLRGDRAALRVLLDRLGPVVRTRAARVLARYSRSEARDFREELRDMVQEVFVVLLAEDARVLRWWQEDGGLSLENFVGLVAERHVGVLLRSGRRSPWTDVPTDVATLDQPTCSAEGDAVAERELLSRVVDRLRAELTPRMMELFYALWVDETPTPTLSRTTGLPPAAIYTARSRISKRARAIACELAQ